MSRFAMCIWCVLAALLYTADAATLLGQYRHISTQVAQASRFKRSLTDHHVPNDSFFLTVPADDDMHDLCLEPQILQDVKLRVVSPTSNESFYQLTNTPESAVVKGYILGDESNSSVFGYIHNGHFFGHLDTGTRKYQLEDARVLRGTVQESGGAPYPLRREERTIMYEIGQLQKTEEAPPKETRRVKRAAEVFGSYGHRIHRKDELHMFNPDAIFFEDRDYKVICRVGLIADHKFFAHSGLNELGLTFLRMVDVAVQLRNIFAPIDWDESGTCQNLDYEFDDMTIYTHTNSPHNPLDEMMPDPSRYLEAFSKAFDFSNFCLVGILSGMKFIGYHRGLAYQAVPRRKTGGLCEESVRINGVEWSRNIFVATAIDKDSDEKMIPNPEFIIRVAQLMAQAMGAPPDEQRCIVDETTKQKDGHYLMYQGNDPMLGNKPNNYRLSNCSKSSIKDVLKEMATCLYPKIQTYCGNGVRESGEECDCGTEYVPYNPCKQGDQKCCCNNKGCQLPLHRKECKLKARISCDQDLVEFSSKPEEIGIIEINQNRTYEPSRSTKLAPFRCAGFLPILYSLYVCHAITR